MLFLQSLVNTQALTEKVDSIDVQKQLTSLAEKVATTSPKELWTEFYHKILSAGEKILLAAIIFVVGYYLIKLIKVLMTRNMTRHRTDLSVQSFMVSLVKTALMVILVMSCANVLGVSSVSIAALIAASGVAIGMAFSGTMSNFAGGLLILFSKPFKHGDRVEINGQAGRVDKISIFNTRILTNDYKVIYIPNGSISNDTIVNHTAENFRRVEWYIGVAYGTPYQLMADTCRQILRKDSRLREKKDGAKSDIIVEINDLQDSAVQFVIKAWTTREDYENFQMELPKEFYTHIPEAGIEFPFPQMDIHMKN